MYDILEYIAVLIDPEPPFIPLRALCMDQVSVFPHIVPWFPSGFQ